MATNLMLALRSRSSNFHKVSQMARIRRVPVYSLCHAHVFLSREEQLLWTSPTTTKKSGILALDRYSSILYCFKTYSLNVKKKIIHVFRE